MAGVLLLFAASMSFVINFIERQSEQEKNTEEEHAAEV